MKTCDEADVILHYRPRVLRLCESRWRYMRMDEKIAEADYFMLCAIRTPSIGAHNFWNAFVCGFAAHMDKCCRDENRRRFACLSLDARRASKDRNRSWTLLDRLPAASPFESTLAVKEFLSSLPRPTRAILLDLIARTPQSQIMRKYGLTPRELKEVRRKLRTAYSAWVDSPPPPDPA